MTAHPKLPMATAGLLTLLAMPAFADVAFPASKNVQFLDPKNADHLVLVAFKDASIDRIQGRASAYRKHGDYGNSTWSEKQGDDIAAQYHLQKITEWPMTAVGVHCIVYQVPSNLSVPDTLQGLMQDSRVDIAQSMHTFSTRATDSRQTQSLDPYYPLQANLHTLHIDEVHSKATGKHITIAMIDTGVDLQHPELLGQITQNENLVDNTAQGDSHDKHGTAVAGVMVAKKDNGTGIIGVAPDANVIALKACWPSQANSMEAICNSYTLALAVNSAIKSGAKILNMSLTGPQDPILALLLNKAISNGMIVVAADTGKNQENDNFPASLKGVIAVQSSGQHNARSIKMTNALNAPGEKILTTLPYGTYDFISGSSIAAAQVSGIVALLLELNPDLTLQELHTLLKKSETRLLNDVVQTVNAKTAVLALCDATAC